MKGIFDAYVLSPFDKKLIFELVMCVNTCDFTVFISFSRGEQAWICRLRNRLL